MNDDASPPAASSAKKAPKRPDLPSALRNNLKRRKASPKAGLHRPPKPNS